MDITVVLLAILLVAAVSAVVVAFWYSLRWLRMRRISGVNVALRWRPESAREGWHLGIGRYLGEQFVWYRVWSLRGGPSRIMHRERLHIIDRREPVGTESYAVPAGSVVLRCRSDNGEVIEVAMGPDALTGFMSWLESAPPGRRLPKAS